VFKKLVSILWVKHRTVINNNTFVKKDATVLVVR